MDVTEFPKAWDGNVYATFQGESILIVIAATDESISWSINDVEIFHGTISGGRVVRKEGFARLLWIVEAHLLGDYFAKILVDAHR